MNEAEINLQSVDCREREITFELGVKALDMTSLGIQLLIVCSVMRMRKSMIKYAFLISLSVRNCLGVAFSQWAC